MATQPPATTGMIERIKNILFSPSTEWDRIDAEPATESGLLTGWVLPLAAISPVAGLIGGQLLGYGAAGYMFKPPIAMALVIAVVGYLLSVVSVWLIAKIIDALAPSFGGIKNPAQAMKAAAYSYTPAFVAGILQIVPQLAIVAALVSLYGFYLLYLGLPKVMKAPQEKAIGYVVVTVLVSIVIYVIVGIVIGAVFAALIQPTLTIPTYR